MKLFGRQQVPSLLLCRACTIAQLQAVGTAPQACTWAAAGQCCPQDVQGCPFMLHAYALSLTGLLGLLDRQAYTSLPGGCLSVKASGLQPHNLVSKASVSSSALV